MEKYGQTCHRGVAAADAYSKSDSEQLLASVSWDTNCDWVISSEHFNQNLDSIDWLSFHHAYGRASDVPLWLRALQYPADEESTRQDFDQLSECLVHQETSYEATLFAVPFLLQLLADRRSAHRACIIELLVSAAVGDTDAFYPEGFDAAKWLDRSPLSSKLNPYDQVKRGGPLLCALLAEDIDPEVRRLCAFAVAWFPEIEVDQPGSILAPLWEMIHLADAPVGLSTSCVLAVGVLSRGIWLVYRHRRQDIPANHGAGVVEELRCLLDRNGRDVAMRWAVHKVLLDLDDVTPPSILHMSLFASNAESSYGEWTELTFCGGHIGNYSETTFCKLVDWKQNDQETVAAVVDALAQADRRAAQFLSGMLLPMVFSEWSAPPFPRLPRFEQLSGVQQLVVLVHADMREEEWQDKWFRGLCMQFGLPGARFERRKYAGLA